MALVLVSAAAACSDPVAPVAQPLAVVGATLVDGTGAAPRTGMTLVLERGRITRVAPDGTVTLDPSVETLDAAGQWVMPGLVDTHVHLPAPADQAVFFGTLLSFGVTTARSTASVPATGVEARASLERGQLLGPRFLTAGPLIDGPTSVWDFAANVGTEAEIRAEVDRQAAAGVDWIKLYVGLAPELVRAGIDQAHQRALPVVGHLGRTTWPEAVAAGIDALTHSCYWGMAHSLVPRADSARFEEFFTPNGAFDIGLIPYWTDVASSADPRFVDFAEEAADRGVSLDPNLVLCEAAFWGNDRDTFERLRTELDVQASRFPHPLLGRLVRGDPRRRPAGLRGRAGARRRAAPAGRARHRRLGHDEPVDDTRSGYPA